MVQSEDAPEIPGRSFLTPKQREYLETGGEDLSNAQKRQHRYQIRQNVISALMDFQLLWGLDDDDLFKTMKPLNAVQGVDLDETAVQDVDETLDYDEEDRKHGEEMYSGLVNLLAVFAYTHTPAHTVALAERGLNLASVSYGLEIGHETEIYDLQAETVDPAEKLEEYPESPPTE